MLSRPVPAALSASRALAQSTRSSVARRAIFTSSSPSRPSSWSSSSSSSSSLSFFYPVSRPIPIPIPIPRPPFSLFLTSGSALSRNYATNSKEAPPLVPGKKPPVDPLAAKARKNVEVSADSSTRHIFTDVGEKEAMAKSDVNMGSALASDLHAVKETFQLKAVPRDAYVLGLAGTIPYLSTSLATLYCAWDLNYAATHGNGFLFSPEYADSMIVFLENLQIGYGAVVCFIV
jgi:hypothetical protein